MRQAVYGDLLGGERAAVHAAVAEALGSAAPSAELAFHWRAAGRDADALRASVRAGLEAEDARRSARRCATSASRSSTGRREPTSCRWTGSSCSGTPPRAPATRASTTRPSPGARRRCGCSTAAPTPSRTALFFERLGRLQTFAGDSGHGAFAEALRLLPPEDRTGRARLLGAEAYALWAVGRLEEAAAHCEAALALADDP